MKDTETLKAEMDAAAVEAGKELETLDANAVQIVGGWLKKHFTQAGYKRLSRLLVARAGQDSGASENQ